MKGQNHFTNRSFNRFKEGMVIWYRGQKRTIARVVPNPDWVNYTPVQKALRMCGSVYVYDNEGNIGKSPINFFVATPVKEDSNG